MILNRNRKLRMSYGPACWGPEFLAAFEWGWIAWIWRPRPSDWRSTPRPRPGPSRGWVTWCWSAQPRPRQCRSLGQHLTLHQVRSKMSPVKEEKNNQFRFGKGIGMKMTKSFKSVYLLSNNNKSNKIFSLRTSNDRECWRKSEKVNKV